ncbi:MAG: hypothetical protein R2707_13580 [Acidimicrobiales bacterium]
MGRCRSLAGIIVALVVVSLWGATPLGAQEDGEVTVEYLLDGRSIEEADSFDPHEFTPRSVGEFVATVTNGTDETVSISSARLRGRMLGMTFLSYDTLVLVDVPAGETVTFSVPVDLYDVDDQAVGFLRADISLLDADREPIVTTGFAVDVRGRTLSAMGIFAVVILVIAVVSTAANVWSLLRRTLPENRYIRGVRFAVSGFSIGLLIAVGFSILRIFPLPGTGWLPLVFIPTIAAFAFGYVLPTLRYGRVERPVPDPA